MSKGIILFADNDPRFLKVRKEFLEKEGYQLIPTADPTEARRILEQGRVDLAILDIRLVKDEDEKDISGLTLAKETARSVPKIILTGFPTYGAVREALGLATGDLPPAVDFLSKQEGPEDMIQAVARTFAQHIRINYELKFTSYEVRLFHDMALRILGSHLGEDELEDKAEELERLFRKLFYDYTEADFEFPMTRQGQVLVRVRLRQQDTQIPLRLLKCGKREALLEEQRAYGDKNRGQLVREWAVLQGAIQESANFGAIVYLASGFDLESSKWMADYFRLLIAEEMNSALDDLFKKAWESLYKQPCSAEQDRTLNLVYQERLGLSRESCSEGSIRQNLRETIEYIQSRHIIRVEADAEGRRLSFSFPDGKQLSCPDPIGYAYKDVKPFGPPVFRRLSLGCMDGYNILVDRESRVCVTDFSTIGPAPALSDFVALEARVRFEWTRSDNLDWSQLREFEIQLTAPRPLEEPMQIGEFRDGSLEKALAVIAHLRTLAARVPGADPQEYQLGLLFQTVGILAGDAPSDRRAHALLAASLICRGLERWEELETA